MVFVVVSIVILIYLFSFPLPLSSDLFLFPLFLSLTLSVFLPLPLPHTSSFYVHSHIFYPQVISEYFKMYVGIMQSNKKSLKTKRYSVKLKQIRHDDLKDLDIVSFSAYLLASKHKTTHPFNRQKNIDLKFKEMLEITRLEYVSVRTPCVNILTL